MSNKRDTENDINMTPGQLKEWMDKHQYTIDELADYLGVTRQAVLYWLSGKRTIPEPMGRLFNFFDLRPHLLKEF